ncbi:MAG: PQQ-dependent sugar dehydrogenase, partial [Mucilaginibacter sp.]
MISFITSLRIFSAFIILWAAFAFGPFSAIAPKDKVRILIISSPFDHPYGSHMYEHEGKLLAKCLEQTPGVEAVTSYGWPKDPAVLKNVKGLVFYSKSAFDLMMADSVTKGQAMELLNNKVGFSCIHMSTLATDDKMIGLLGARWYFKWLPGERLNLDVRPTGIIQADPKHPISRGWKDFEMRDEIYLSTIFHPKAKPLVKAKAFAGEEVVAWTFERENGGRSFGTTLGHFHQTFRTEAFRKLLVNAILWTAGVKVPKDGAPVNITPAEDILPPNPRAAAIAAAQPIDEGRFEKQVLVPACNDPMQIAVRGNGDVYFIERNGNLRLYDVKSKHVKTLGTVPVYNQGEVGMLGFALDNGFDKSQALYLFFCPAEKNTNMRLSRFVLKNGMLDMTSEKMLFEYPGDTNNGHQGGGIYMSADGDLLIGTGDNTNHMLELPVDQREGFEKFDAQRSSANTNSLRGKILRIHPLADGSYTIPPGNLFEKTDRTRPEIFAMGVRNGFRVVEDP